MKIFLLGIVLAGFGYFGVQIKQNLKRKTIFFEEWVSFCENYKREITFLKCNLKTIVEKCIDKNGLLNDIFKDFFSNKKIKITYLTIEEQDLINTFLCTLGKKDVDGEINNVEFYEGKFKEILSKQNKTFATYGNFSIKMSLVVGLLVCILLI